MAYIITTVQINEKSEIWEEYILSHEYEGYLIFKEKDYYKRGGQNQ